MNEADAIALSQSAMAAMIVLSWPALLAAMGVGVVIAFVQALTQIQEATLTFVPKMAAIMLALALSAHYAGARLSVFTHATYGRIATGY